MKLGLERVVRGVAGTRAKAGAWESAGERARAAAVDAEGAAARWEQAIPGDREGATGGVVGSGREASRGGWRSAGER